MDSDFWALFAAVVSVLALLASVFSAFYAGRAARTAEAAEKRTAESNRQAAQREMARCRAHVEAECDALLKLLNDCDIASRSQAVMFGGRGGSREKLVTDETQSRRDRVTAILIAAQALRTTGLDDDVGAAAQIELDASTAALAAIRSKTERDLAEFDQVRATWANREVR